MRRLPHPQRLAADVYQQCALHVAPALRLGVASCSADVALASANYAQLGAGAQLHLYAHSPIVAADAVKERMAELYDYPLRDGPKRMIYDEILSGAPLGICPQCGVNRVFTLDHYLPRAVFCELAVIPANLVPCCRDCNFVKGQYRSVTAGGLLFHPYFDDWSEHRLLRADYNHAPSPSFHFYVQGGPGTPATVVQRAQTHLRVLQLDVLYAMNAGAALVEVRENCRRAAGNTVQDYLSLMADRLLARDQNAWKGVMYECLASNDEFCEGGYWQY